MIASSRKAAFPVTLAFSLFGVLAFVPFSTARAGGFAIGEQSAVAGGTGGAGTARQDDPAAAWYNPAALAGGEGGWQGSVGLLGVSPQVEAQALDGSWQTRTEQNQKTPPQVYAAWSRGRFATGASVNVPFGSGVSWPGGWEGRYEIVSSSLQVIRVAPFAAWSFGKLKVAAGPHADLARMQIGRKLDMVDTEGEVSIDLAGHGLGGHAALLYEASDRWTLGATYRSRTRIDLEGQADFTVPDAFAGKASDQRARSHITVPDLLTAGVAFAPNARWTFLADLGLADWSVYDEVRIDFEDEDTTDVRTTPRWQPTVSVRGGAELHGSKATARLGFLLDPSPAPARTLAPSSPDSHRVGVTAGASLDLGRSTRLDAFYEYLHLLGRETRNEEALQARYEGHAHMIGLGLRFAR